MDAAPVSPLPPADPAGEPSSLTDRLAAVITAPGEVFEEIRQAPVRASNWVAPLILSCIATAVYFCIAFSQPDILRSAQEQGQIAAQKRVAAGKITQAQADQAAAMAAKFMTPTTLKIVGASGSVLACVGGLFLMGLGIWLALKCCAAPGPGYMKVVEVCALGLVIDVVQKVVRIWLVMWKQNLLATVSPAFFLDHPVSTNRTAVFLSMFDLIDIWWLAVLSLGVSKIASIRYGTAALITFGIWFGFRIVVALLTTQ